MRFVVWTVSPIVLSLLVWTCFGACVDVPHRAPPAAHVIVEWDLTACGAPHRVVVELADDDTASPVSISAPCELGGMTIDAVPLGEYHGRAYAWELGQPIRSVAPLELEVDEAVVRMSLDTPR
ncbi:MAG TPA: hypothetical protein VLX92_22400 [Kofleriaceae bacterium]|nr:hypothetical protein [Kofleriaceae bacterium]